MLSDDHLEYDLPRPTEPPVAHPLAYALASAAPLRKGPIRIVGFGSGRNLAPFLAADMAVEVLEGDPVRSLAIRARYGDALPVVCADYADPVATQGARGRFVGILSTHALLHGTSRTLALALANVRETIARGGALYATFGSTNDPRATRGERLDASTTVERSGPEAGVPHVFLDRASLERLLAGFEVLDARESSAAQSVGSWAHAERDAETIVHWFVKAIVR